MMNMIGCCKMVNTFLLQSLLLTYWKSAGTVYRSAIPTAWMLSSIL